MKNILLNSISEQFVDYGNYRLSENSSRKAAGRESAFFGHSRPITQRNYFSECLYFEQPDVL
jgi:hypothetical protein